MKRTFWNKANNVNKRHSLTLWPTALSVGWSPRNTIIAISPLSTQITLSADYPKRSRQGSPLCRRAAGLLPPILVTRACLGSTILVSAYGRFNVKMHHPIRSKARKISLRKYAPCWHIGLRVNKTVQTELTFIGHYCESGRKRNQDTISFSFG